MPHLAGLSRLLQVFLRELYARVLLHARVAATCKWYTGSLPQLLPPEQERLEHPTILPNCYKNSLSYGTLGHCSSNCLPASTTRYFVLVYLLTDHAVQFRRRGVVCHTYRSNTKYFTVSSIASDLLHPQQFGSPGRTNTCTWNNGCSCCFGTTAARV